jgi:hypothetical protein
MSKQIKANALKTEKLNIVSIDASKAETVNIMPVNYALNMALLKLENTTKEYVNQGKNPAGKARREKEMVDLVNGCVVDIEIKCPPYMVWDPITGTCVIG